MIDGIADMFAELDGRADYFDRLLVLSALVDDTIRRRDRERMQLTRQRVKSGALVVKRHGFTAYGKGCRCSECRTANTTYMREYQRRRATEPAFRAKRRKYDATQRAKPRAA